MTRLARSLVGAIVVAALAASSASVRVAQARTPSSTPVRLPGFFGHPESYPPQ